VSATNPQTLAAVAITYRRPEALGKTLQAVLDQTRPPDLVIVVDNDPEGSAAATAASFGATYLPMRANLGPAGGISAGIGWVIERTEIDWLILIDDDDPPSGREVLEVLAGIARSLCRDAQFGGVGLVGARYDRRRGAVVRLADSELRGLVDVDCIGGGQFPLYSADALRNVALPDARLFFGFDDLDLGLRLRDGGYRLVCDGDSWHEGRSKAGRLGLSSPRSALPAWRRYYSVRNQILIARRYGRRPALHATMRGIASGSRELLCGRWREGLSAVRGVTDGVAGRTGARVMPTANPAKSAAASPAGELDDE
jgi:GT2 family glycosyltransferase